MKRAAVSPAVVVAIAAIALAGCGGSGHSATTPAARAPSTAPADTSTGRAAAAKPAAGAKAPKARMSPAKRRYLAHFTTGCSSGDRLASAASARLQALVSQIAGGDVTAVGRLTRYLAQLSQAFGHGLARIRALGAPPGPDADAGRAYIDQAARLVAAIRQLGRSVARLDAHGIAAANGELRSANAAAHVAAQRYGFDTCTGGSGAGGSGAKAAAPSGVPVA